MRTVRSAPLVLAAIAIATALTLAGCQPAVVASSAALPDTVTVQGFGTALAAPDKAELSFSVFAKNADAKAAMSKAGADGEAIVAALKKAGVAKEDIQTTGVTLQAEYAYQEGESPRITGYRADVTVKATVRDIAKIADVITAGTQAGAKSVAGPTFLLDDDNPTKFEAVKRAVADAKARAEAMAGAGGRKVGEVVSMADSAVAAEAPSALERAYATKADMAGAVPQAAIEPGQLEMTAQVTVVYRLK
ncbi:MAG: DUF541 domain-containing protein [Actinobacteria bacterium]|nr:MAG: DUF541 domain-containing protein [Actinomycetota bacterium]